MRKTIILLALLFPTAAMADDACMTAANQAMDATVAATITLAQATKYMTAHDDWCDGVVQSLEEQDGAAVDHAWSEAIRAQGVCISNDKAQVQMTKLITSLHNRRLKISNTLGTLKAKCN